MGLLDGKVAIITGGGKGIGFGIASAFAEQGASLFITGRTEGRLAEAAEKLKANTALMSPTPLPRAPTRPRSRRLSQSASSILANLTLW